MITKVCGEVKSDAVIIRSSVITQDSWKRHGFLSLGVWCGLTLPSKAPGSSLVPQDPLQKACSSDLSQSAIVWRKRLNFRRYRPAEKKRKKSDSINPGSFSSKGAGLLFI